MSAEIDQSLDDAGATASAVNTVRHCRLIVNGGVTAGKSFLNRAVMACRNWRYGQHCCSQANEASSHDLLHDSITSQVAVSPAECSLISRPFPLVPPDAPCEPRRARSGTRPATPPAAPGSA